MTADERISEAEQAHDELRAALTAAGVKLPSLALDITTFAGAAPFVLIDLGRCNVPTARSLADALREKAVPTTAELICRAEELDRLVREHLARRAGSVHGESGDAEHDALDGKGEDERHARASGPPGR